MSNRGPKPVMRFAYADPPYIGQAWKHYRCAEVDHAQLIKDLGAFDGWALSLSSPTLKTILNLCPDGVRVGAWVKPFSFYKIGVNPAYSWEPVIYRVGRKRGRGRPTTPDWVSANATRKRGVVGTKPDDFSRWIFEILGMEPGDEFVDLFPGSGAVTAAWKAWQAA